MAYEITNKITNLFLYGGNSTPYKNSDTLIRPASITHPIYTFNLQDFMDNGGGRFAVGPEFDIVDRFFSEHVPAGVYTKQDIAAYFGYDPVNDFYGWNMQHYDFSDAKGAADLAERTYVFGSMSFMLTDAIFNVPAVGDRYINNYAIQPYILSGKPENFDFKSENLPTIIGNEYLQPRVDPSNLGRTVDFEFTGTVATHKYTYNDYVADLGKIASWSTPTLLATKTAIDGLLDQLWASGITKFLDGKKPILYGTDSPNSLSASQITLLGYPTLYDYKSNGIVLIGGKGNDTLSGAEHDDKLYGNADNDTLTADKGKDSLYGGDGNDTLSGGENADKYFFTGAYGTDIVNDTGDGDSLIIDGHALTGPAAKTGAGTYALHGFNLTKTGSTLLVQKGANSITLNNWSDGDYGITLVKPDSGVVTLSAPSGFFVFTGPHGVEDAALETAYEILGYSTPLVVDLDKDGLDLTQIFTLSGTFDIDNDGFTEYSGWVKPDDGFLVVDKNNNGVIDNQGELFGGDASGTAWAKLSAYDSNHDGKVTSTDTNWAKIKIWRDLNQDELTTPNELFTPTALGVGGFGVPLAAAH